MKEELFEVKCSYFTDLSPSHGGNHLKECDFDSEKVEENLSNGLKRG